MGLFLVTEDFPTSDVGMSTLALAQQESSGCRSTVGHPGRFNLQPGTLCSCPGLRPEGCQAVMTNEQRVAMPYGTGLALVKHFNQEAGLLGFSTHTVSHLHTPFHTGS